MREAVRTVNVSAQVETYIADLVRDAKRRVRLGGSSCSSMALYRATQAWAFSEVATSPCPMMERLFRRSWAIGSSSISTASCEERRLEDVIDGVLARWMYARQVVRRPRA
jgi:hypothetical protein